MHELLARVWDENLHPELSFTDVTAAAALEIGAGLRRRWVERLGGFDLFADVVAFCKAHARALVHRRDDPRRDESAYGNRGSHMQAGATRIVWAPLDILLKVLPPLVRCTAGTAS